MKKNKQEKFGPSYFGPIAHRGYHDAESTENGLAAFQKAIDKGLPFELDIHLTKDGELIVCHDSELERVTGKPGIIENLTAKEIRDSYRLKDGGVVPTFQEVLDLNQERSLIVVELKAYNHNHRALAEAAMQALKGVKDKKKYVFISFDPRALFPVKKTGIANALLLVESHPYVWFSRRFFDSIDISKNMIELPKVRRYAKKHIVNVWTIETAKEFEKYAQIADALTFQGFEPPKK